MKSTILSIVIGVALIGAAVLFSNDNEQPLSSEDSTNVSIQEGKQIIEIKAKDGYSPNVTIAKADVPSVIKMSTSGTFDCSAAVSIPSLAIQESLPSTGTTEIEVPPQKAGTKLQGTCGMGMQNFEIAFE